MENWHQVATLDEIPPLGSRKVHTDQGDIALFRTADGEIFALRDRCPHKGGPLSQGIVSGKQVTCPLHGWNINLDDGNAIAPDIGCAGKVAVRMQGGNILISL
ncbi:MAG: nitrite reductase small subunit NirD [Sideroxydans sp.]|nr:nitrite reductase small subunit NirD [Sideroxydans sp.]